jgi:hypothetical protein
MNAKDRPVPSPEIRTGFFPYWRQMLIICKSEKFIISFSSMMLVPLGSCLFYWRRSDASCTPGALIIITLLSMGFAFWMLSSLLTGEVHTKYGTFRRLTEPVRFWWFISNFTVIYMSPLITLLPSTPTLIPPAEQAGSGQPATSPESKSEGGDKPQLEAEGISR